MIIRKNWVVLLLSCCMVYSVQCSAKNEQLKLGNYSLLEIQTGITPGYEGHPDASYCKDFKMTESQIRDFFSKAKVISSSQLHDEYDWSPCYIEGKLSQGTETSIWKIYASKVGEIKKKNSDTINLGCKNCGRPFFNF